MEIATFASRFFYLNELICLWGGGLGAESSRLRSEKNEFLCRFNSIKWRTLNQISSELIERLSGEPIATFNSQIIDTLCVARNLTANKEFQVFSRAMTNRQKYARATRETPSKGRHEERNQLSVITAKIAFCVNSRYYLMRIFSAIAHDITIRW